MAFFVDAESPVGRSVWRGKQALAVGAIENVEVAIALGLHEHLARLPVEVCVDEDRGFYGIPVMGIVW